MTLKSVAERAGVSTATVSKVLSNTPYVSERTRSRVLKAVEDLGYVPNLAARALSKGFTYIMGVVFPHNYDALFADPLIVSIVNGVEAVCIERGYNVLISTPHAPVRESEQYQRLVHSGYWDGVIAIETLPGTPISTLLEQYHYPWVALGYTSAAGTLNTIHPDDFAGAKAAATYLLQLGHRYIGILGVEEADLVAATPRLLGYAAAFEENGLRFEDAPRVNGAFSLESGYQAVGELLSRSPRPTALLCLNDRMAMGAIHRARSQGLRIPQDVSVIGFDDIPGAAFFDPALTTVSQPAHEMGAESARHVFEMIDLRSPRTQNPPDTKFDPIVFPTQLIIRNSSGPPPRP